MNTHIEALERLASRGSPRGADVLIRDIGESLADYSTATVRPIRSRRRPPGPIWAAIVAVLVLAAGLVGGWIAGPSDEVSRSGVSWHRVEAAESVFEVASGPGGFISVVRPAALGVWSSPDGVSWIHSPLPDSHPAFIESVLATQDRWLVTGSEGENQLAWWSEDGRTWTQVDWPPEVVDTIQQITSTSEYFFLLSRDVFDEGTTLWRSPDAETWTEIPTGPVTAASGFLEGTKGGLVLRDEAGISVSTDGTTWSTATLASPSELGAGRVRIEAVDHLGDQWVAIIGVERVDQDPVLAVLSSEDGESWNFESIPPFGRVDDVAPGVQATATIGDRLIVIPVQTPTSTQEDGMVVADGFVRNTRQIWSTTNGVDWVLELSADKDIIDADGAVVNGQPIGVWIGFGDQATGEATPSITTPAMPEEPIDPDGLEFQAAVTEDGTVTIEEFEQAVEHWKTCMEEHGVTNVEASIDRSGGWSASYAAPSPHGENENAIDNLCQESWVTQVLTTLAGP